MFIESCDALTLAAEAVEEAGLTNAVGEVEIGFNSNDARGCADLSCGCTVQAWFSFVLDYLAIG